jgi:multisubunit Na+/H+ antiporter MnhG subunit
MENSTNTQHKGINSESANNPSHYTLMTFGIVIIIIGVFLRFFTALSFINLLSNLIFLVGVFLCLKAVMRILK